jgi:methanogenic corrinoid protein MtbC1
MTFMGQVANSSGWPTSRQDQPGSTAQEHVGLLARSRRTTLISRIVEKEILPRLILAAANAHAEPTTNQTATDNDTAELVRRLMGREDDSAWHFIEHLASLGATPGSLYLGIITRAARLLGELWEDDRCDFAQVTISLGRLQQAIRALSPSFQAAAVTQSAHADTILLLPAPGEQHTLGLVILSEFFHREGWHVIGGPALGGSNTAGIVDGQWIDVIGFSLGSIKHFDALAASIRAARKASRNRSLGIMVGGPLFLQRPELVTRVGADTTATDAPGAIRQAKGLLSIRAAAD